MASVAVEAHGPSRVSAAARWALLLVGVTTTAAVGMFIVGALVQQVVAGEHGQFHAMFAAVFLAPAVLLAARRPGGGRASTAPIVGLTVAAITQLVEGVGGFGYGPGNADRVNALAQVHDLGVAVAPIGLVAAALGVTLGVAQLIRPRFGTVPALVLATVLMGGLGFVIARMIGA